MPPARLATFGLSRWEGEGDALAAHLAATLPPPRPNPAADAWERLVVGSRGVGGGEGGRPPVNRRVGRDEPRRYVPGGGVARTSSTSAHRLPGFGSLPVSLRAAIRFGTPASGQD